MPNYGIFEPVTGELELYQLQETGQYPLASANADGRFWIAEMGLYLGIWQGTRKNCPSNWLRWWDEQGNAALIPPHVITHNLTSTVCLQGIPAS